MNIVTRNKSLVAIIIFLLVSNIAMLIFFLALGNSTKKDHSRKDIIGNFLKKDIGFDQQQMDQYEKIHKDHREFMKPYFEGIRNAKDSFYSLLSAPMNDSSLNSAGAPIGARQIELDISMFKHLSNVRNLCNKEQLPKFDSLFKNVISRITGHPRRDPKDQKEK